MNKVQRGLKFSVVFLVKHNFLWLIPEAAPNILQRQPCLRENSYPSCHLCFPSLADEFRGAAQSGTPEADGEQLGAESNSQHLCLSHPQSQLVSARLITSFSPCVGAEGSLHHHPHAWLVKWGEPLCPRLSGGQGSEQDSRQCCWGNVYIGLVGS